MSQLTVPIVRTAALPAGYCYPADPNTFFQDIVARIIGMFTNNLNGVIIADTAPGANDRDKLWFNTHSSDNNLYSWVTNIGWARKHPVPVGSVRRFWFPLETDLTAEDGGNANAVADADGPFWQRDTTFDGRFPLAKGTIPGTNPAVTVTDGETDDSAGHEGEYSHAITEAEGGVRSHVHAFGKSNNAAGASGDDAYFSQTGMRTVPSYSGTYITGSSSVITAALTEADLFTLPPGTDGAGVTNPDKMILMPPFLCGIWAYRTARIYILPS